jgi:uncharacterized protein (DUF1697 family)
VPRYVGLLRGVNLGSTNKVAMPALRELFEKRGYHDVVTYIQSGNILFSAPKAVKPTEVEEAVDKEFGLAIRVVLETPAGLRRVVAGNPFTHADPSKLHVGFYVRKPPAVAVRAVAAEDFSPDEVHIRGTHVYLHLPDGMGRSRLPGFLDRKLRTPCTIRTWNTVTKLLELATG